MKFTDGYWLRSEHVQASYAMQAFTVEEIPGGLRIAAPERPIRTRADALDITVLYIDLVSAGEDDIEVRLSHHFGYDTHEARFDLTPHPAEPKITITDTEATLSSGALTARVDRETCAIRFERNGRFLTGTGFRNIGYMRVNKEPTPYRMDPHYFEQRYEPHMLFELSVRPGEAIYGFGERFTPFVKNGQTVNIWNEDGGTASDVAYKNIPFYLSSEGYGVFTDSTGPVSYEVCSEKVEYVGVSVPGEQLRLHVLAGDSMKDVLQRYTDLTGKPALPPAWSFGLWLSTSFKPTYDEETVTNLIGGMQERQIPLRVFHFDCYWMRALHWCDFEWDPAAFADVKGMLERYHQKGLKLCCWINPYVAQNTDMYREGAARGYFLMRADGRGVKQVDNWQPGLSIVDFTNPEAAAWYAGKVKGLLEAGIDAIKTDFGERIPLDVKYYDGSDPVSMHNYFTYIYNRTVFTAIEEVRGRGDAVVFGRSATAGSQKFPVQWGGDSSASYASMAETLRGGLSFSMSGFSFWSHDIAGFEQTATPDVYKRWAQFGLLSSHSRLHGSDSYRVPWIFDDEANDVVRFFSELKNSMMPYYYAVAVEAHETGIPFLRPMPLEFPDDPACRTLDLQYMLGSDVLAAPIFNEESLGRFYLPGLRPSGRSGACAGDPAEAGANADSRVAAAGSGASGAGGVGGKWYNLIDGEILEGGRWYERTYSYLDLPFFAREGALIPFGGRKDVPDYDYADAAKVWWILPEDGMTASCRIPDLKGETAAEISARRDGEVVIFAVSGTLTDAEALIVLPDGTKRTGMLTDGAQIALS